MKILRLLRAYTRGIRMPLLVLTFMMLVALFLAVLVVSQVCYIQANYDAAASVQADPDQVYFYTVSGYSSGAAFGEWFTFQQQVREDPAVDRVFVCRTAQMVTCQVDGKEESISIILYEPGLNEFFPAVKQAGAEFTDPSGVILCSPLFSGMEEEGTITLNFARSRTQADLPIIGHLEYPYRFMDFGSSGSKVSADDLFSTGSFLLMEGNAENIAWLTEVAALAASPNFYFTLKPDCTAEEKTALFETLKETGSVRTLAEILENSREKLRDAIRQRLPLPLFLLGISSFAFFSTVILIFKKKEKELAILHLCGGSRSQCMTLVLLTFVLTALIPTALAFLGVLAAPELAWQGIITLDFMLLDERSLALVVGYFLVTQALAVGAAWLQMRGHTPLGLLKGVQK